MNILLICKVDQERTVQISGPQAQLNFFKIDRTISWQTPVMQTGAVDPTRPLAIHGYTVALLQGFAPKRRS